jgi:pseudo-rSAM protein
VQHKDAKLSYLSYVTLFLGGKCKQTEYYRQVLFPVNSEIQLSGDDAEKFIRNIGPDYLKNVNIVVSDPSENSYVIDIAKRIAAITEKVSLVIPLSDNNKKTCLELTVQANASFKSVFVCCADDISKDTIKELSDKGHFNLLVRNENEYSHLETIVEGLSDADYDVFPVYEDNLAFFEKNIFMSKKDLKSLSPSKREVFAHQAINTNFFGELTLMPDGTVYTNVNLPSVGTVNDSIYDIVRKALNKDEAWLYLRDKAPCSHCLYQWLCPSVSNYEIVMNRMDLCLQPKSDNFCFHEVKRI